MEYDIYSITQITVETKTERASTQHRTFPQWNWEVTLNSPEEVEQWLSNNAVEDKEYVSIQILRDIVEHRPQG